MSIWFLLAESLLRGFASEMRRLFSDFGVLIRDIIRAFPNVVAIADLIARFATSVLGRLFAAPVNGVGEMLIARLKEVNLHNRLIRVDEAIRMFTRGHEEAIQAITLTDETGLVGLIAGGIARRVYTLVKRIPLISKLIAAKTQEEFVILVLNSIKSRAWLFVWAVLIVAVLGVVVVASVWISMTCLCIVFLKDLHLLYILPQDSKRTWRRGGAVHRKNLRRGPDASEHAELSPGAATVAG